MGNSQNNSIDLICCNYFNSMRNINQKQEEEKDDLFQNKSKENKITLEYKIDKPGENIRLFGQKFIENNKDKCLMCINFVLKKITEFYKSKNNEKKIIVSLALNNNITDLSYMFYGCSSLILIQDLNKLNTSNLTNISSMFSGCSSLIFINGISEWNTNNIINMSYLFNECSSLEEVPDISKWYTSKVINMEHMFSLLSSLKTLPNIGEWDIEKVVNISSMFYGCSSLNYLPDISTWNTKNINNISYLFCRNCSLKSLPNISKWETSKVADMSYLFYGCSSLNTIPDISKWKTERVTDMSHMFHGCALLKSLPLISKWKTNNVTNLSYMFQSCSSLTSLDDISKWNTDKIINIKMIFSNCPLLSPLPDISNWKCNKNNNIRNIKNKNQNNEENKIEIKGAIHNDNLKFIPQIELKFNSIDKYEPNLILKLRKEIKNILNTDNFSIIEIKKGSLTVILTLQCLILKELKQMDKETNITESFYENINSEASNFVEKLKNHEFMSLGTVKPDFVDLDIMDISEKENQKKMSKKIAEIAKKNNKKDSDILEEAKYITSDDLQKYFTNLSLEAEEQENNLNELINRLDEFNKVFDEEIEIAFKNSIFEYKIIHIFLVDKEKDEYIKAKNKCPENRRVVRILFHGTNVNAITSILSTNFNEAREHFFGKGVYFTDILDYAWYYGGENNRINFNRIPCVGDIFTCIASEIYYDNTKLEKVYNFDKEDEPVQKNGIRCGFANFGGMALDKSTLEGYTGFIGNEYILTYENQYLPLYGIVFKRVEFLVIWRDYNFNPENPNDYDIETFNKIQEFHRKIKKYLSR